MAAKKSTVSASVPQYTVSNCSIINSTAANEHTRAAVEALADAVAENARAIVAIAESLKTAGNANMETGIRLGGS